VRGRGRRSSGARRGGGGGGGALTPTNVRFLRDAHFRPPSRAKWKPEITSNPPTYFTSFPRLMTALPWLAAARSMAGKGYESVASPLGSAIERMAGEKGRWIRGEKGQEMDPGGRRPPTRGWGRRWMGEMGKERREISTHFRGRICGPIFSPWRRLEKGEESSSPLFTAGDLAGTFSRESTRPHLISTREKGLFPLRLVPFFGRQPSPASSFPNWRSCLCPQPPSPNIPGEEGGGKIPPTSAQWNAPLLVYDLSLFALSPRKGEGRGCRLFNEQAKSIEENAPLRFYIAQLP